MEVTTTNEAATQLITSPLLFPSLKKVDSVWYGISTSLPLIISTITGIAYETFKKIVQDAEYALNATLGPIYNNPKRTLKTKQSPIVRTGTSSFGEIREKKRRKMIPSSRAMAYVSRLALVIQPNVPLMKHTASISVRIVAAARLPVAWRMSSEIGMFVGVVRIVSGSTMQNRITIRKIVPLWFDIDQLRFKSMSLRERRG
jgi:hypothetical protein